MCAGRVRKAHPVLSPVPSWKLRRFGVAAAASVRRSSGRNSRAMHACAAVLAQAIANPKRVRSLAERASITMTLDRCGEPMALKTDEAAEKVRGSSGGTAEGLLYAAEN